MTVNLRLVVAAAAVAVAVACVFSPRAFAGDPSLDALVDALTPSAAALRSHTTRGIVAEQPDEPVAPPDAAPRRHAHARAAAYHPQADLASADIVVQFSSNSASLTSDAQAGLDLLGKALSSGKLASYRFRIEGHTDTVGTDDVNQALSERRAQTVAAYLESHYDIAADKLEAVGMGKAGLLVPTPDQTNEPRNRRVHIVTLPG